MRHYTPDERGAARDKLPTPLATFLGSRALTDIYLGIRDKLKLNLRQLMIVSDIANATLLGLEQESALETNLHQYLPELSNADTRELVADINDRVFKEAKRRLQENIVETKAPLEGDMNYGEDATTPEAGTFVSTPHPLENTMSAVEPESFSLSNATNKKIPSALNIAEGKLAEPLSAKAEAVFVEPTVVNTEENRAPEIQTPSAALERYKETDPYREPIE